MKPETAATILLGSLLCIAGTATAFPPEIPDIQLPPEGFAINETPDWCPFGYNNEAFVNLCFASGGDFPGNFYSRDVYIIGNASVELLVFDPESGFTVPVGIYGDALCNIEGLECGCIQIGRQEGPTYDPFLIFCTPLFN